MRFSVIAPFRRSASGELVPAGGIVELDLATASRLQRARCVVPAAVNAAGPRLFEDAPEAKTAAAEEGGADAPAGFPDPMPVARGNNRRSRKRAQPDA